MLSPCIFNAVLESVFRRWKGKLAHHGWSIPGEDENLTNVRFAGDIVVYAKTLLELKEMLILLFDELASVGLQVNADKTKILTTERFCPPLGGYSRGACGQTYSHVLGEADAHKYLGRALNFPPQRAQKAVHKRIFVRWMRFRKHRHILTSTLVPAKLEAKLFNSTVVLAILFSLSTLTLGKEEHKARDTTRNKMLRCIAGWRRHSGEDWPETMGRMRGRVDELLQGSCCLGFSRQAFSAKWCLANRLLTGSGKRSEALLKLRGVYPRGREQPPTQWVDDIPAFQAECPGGLECDYVAYCESRRCS